MFAYDLHKIVDEDGSFGKPPFLGEDGGYYCNPQFVGDCDENGCICMPPDGAVDGLGRQHLWRWPQGGQVGG